jgi:DNA-directed RNA polymerase subunit RPC12/RpoP
LYNFFADVPDSAYYYIYRPIIQWVYGEKPNVDGNAPNVPGNIIAGPSTYTYNGAQYQLYPYPEPSNSLYYTSMYHVCQEPDYYGINCKYTNRLTLYEVTAGFCTVAFVLAIIRLFTIIPVMAMQAAGEEITLYHCKHCKKTFTTKEKADQHFNQTHASEIITCYKCNEELTRIELDDHKGTCKGEKGEKEESDSSVSSPPPPPPELVSPVSPSARQKSFKRASALLGFGGPTDNMTQCPSCGQQVPLTLLAHHLTVECRNMANQSNQNTSPSIEMNTINTQYQQQNMYPNSGVQQNMYPNSGVQQNMYPNPVQQQNMYPDPVQQPNMYPNPVQQQNMYPNPVQQQNMYPNTGTQQNMYPNTGTQQNMYPNTGSPYV